MAALLGNALPRYWLIAQKSFFSLSIARKMPMLIALTSLATDIRRNVAICPLPASRSRDVPLLALARHIGTKDTQNDHRNRQILQR
jgi:hypothetical protein